MAVWRHARTNQILSVFNDNMLVVKDDEDPTQVDCRQTQIYNPKCLREGGGRGRGAKELLGKSAEQKV